MLNQSNLDVRQNVEIQLKNLSIMTDSGADTITLNGYGTFNIIKFKLRLFLF